MRRTLFSLGIALALAASALLAGAPSAVGAPAAHGIAKCRVLPGGVGMVSPGLTPVGSPGGVKITFTAKLGPVPGAVACAGGVTAPAGVTVTGGSMTGSGFYLPVPATGNASSCANFATTNKVGNIKVVITWSTIGGPIANTGVVYSGNTGTVAVVGGVDVITLTAPTGSATKSGSFAFPPTGAPHTIKIRTTLPGPPCGPGPYSSFSISAGAVAM